MKKIRQSFHMIAAAVFCIIVSVQTRLFSGSGQAMEFDTGCLGYNAGDLNALKNTTVSLGSRTGSMVNNYIKKVFFWLGGPGDRKERQKIIIKIPLPT